MHRLISFLIAAAAALALAAPALAHPPAKRALVVEGDEQPIDCGNGVVLTEHFTFTSERITSFDKDGNRTRFIDHGFYDGVIVNEATGTRFRDRNHYTLRVDLAARTLTYDGASFQIHELGGGPVLILDVGHIVYSLPHGSELLAASAQHPIAASGVDSPALEQVFCETLGSR